MYKKIYLTFLFGFTIFKILLIDASASDVLLPPISYTIAMGGNSKVESEGVKNGFVDKKKNKKAKIVKKKKFIMVRGPFFKGRETFKRADILKIAMDEIIKTNKYELIFTEPQKYRKANFKYFELHMEGASVEWASGVQGYNLEFYMVDGRTGKMIHYVSAERVRDKHLLFKARKLIYEVLYNIKSPSESSTTSDQKKNKFKKNNQSNLEPDEDIKELVAEFNKKIILESGKESDLDSNVLNGESVKRSSSMYQVLKPTKKKKASFLDDIDEPQINESRKQKNRNLMPESGIASSAISSPLNSGRNQTSKIAYAKTPEKLSEEINNEMKKIIAQYKAAQKKKVAALGSDDEDKNKEDKKDKKALTEGGGNPNLMPQVKGLGVGDGGSSEKSKKKYSLSVDLIYQTIRSEDLIIVNNNFKYIGVSFDANIVFDQKTKDFLDISTRITQAIDSDNFDIPGFRQLGVHYNKGLGDFFLYPRVGLEYETQSFVNLAEIGGGLTVAENNLLWYSAGIYGDFSIFNQRFQFLGEFSKSFIGTTDYAQGVREITMDGEKQTLMIGYSLLSEFHFQFTYSSAEMQSQGLNNLKNTQETTYFTLIYSL